MQDLSAKWNHCLAGCACTCTGTPCDCCWHRNTSTPRWWLWWLWSGLCKPNLKLRIVLSISSLTPLILFRSFFPLNVSLHYWREKCRSEDRHMVMKERKRMWVQGKWTAFLFCEKKDARTDRPAVRKIVSSALNLFTFGQNVQKTDDQFVFSVQKKSPGSFFWKHRISAHLSWPCITHCYVSTGFGTPVKDLWRKRTSICKCRCNSIAPKYVEPHFVLHTATLFAST